MLTNDYEANSETIFISILTLNQKIIYPNRRIHIIFFISALQRSYKGLIVED